MKKIVRGLLIMVAIAAVVYGYTRIPYFVVKQNLTLQNNYTYETYDEVLKKRAFYLTEEYYNSFFTRNSLQERIQYIKDHKETCTLLYLELGIRQADGTIPYSAAYQLSYEDGETPTQTIHVEGVQMLERTWLFWWKVSENGTTHSCTDLHGEEEHIH